MTKKLRSCPFDDIDTLREEERVVRIGDTCLTIVSRPWFWQDHALVIPRRHVAKLSELTADERLEMLEEAERLADKVDQGYGSQVFQKSQPGVSNGITMSHVHMHVYPRLEGDRRPIPTPVPNHFDAMVFPTPEEIAASVARLAQD